MNYKFIFILGIVFLLSFCFGCVRFNSRAVTQQSDASDIQLMPFWEWETIQTNPTFLQTTRHGYFNLQTFEVVIPAQFAGAGHFVGNFAVVERDRGQGRSNKFSIINQEGIEIVRNVDRARLFQSECGNTTLALTEVHSGLMWDGRREFFNLIPSPSPRNTTVRWYNLSSGRRIFRERGGYTTRRDPFRRIMFVDNYLILPGEPRVFPEFIARINADGRFEYVDTITVDELMARSKRERNLERAQNDFRFRNEHREHFIDQYFFYIADRFDIAALFKNIPEGLALVRELGLESHPDLNSPIYSIRPFNRNAVYPLKRTHLLYIVHLARSEADEKYVDSRGIPFPEWYRGLWDPAENKWIIHPAQNQEIFQTPFDDWVLTRITRHTFSASGIYTGRELTSYLHNIPARERYRLSSGGFPTGEVENF